MITFHDLHNITKSRFDLVAERRSEWQDIFKLGSSKQTDQKKTYRHPKTIQKHPALYMYVYPSLASTQAQLSILERQIQVPAMQGNEGDLLRSSYGPGWKN